MQKSNHWPFILAGTAAGLINGLFGAGGGMVLVPLLSLSSRVKETDVFPISISIILPICLVSLAITAATDSIAWSLALPYLFGSVLGGIAAGKLGKKIPVTWLHRSLGILILWGGIRNLC